MEAFLGRQSVQGLRNFLNLEVLEDCPDYVRTMVKAQQLLTDIMDWKEDRRQSAKTENKKEFRDKQNSFPVGTVVWIKANISATDPLHKLRARYKGAYIVTKETHSQVHVVPWGLRETILDKSPLHILGQGKPQIRRTAQKVDKSRLKRHEGLSP